MFGDPLAIPAPTGLSSFKILKYNSLMDADDRASASVRTNLPVMDRQARPPAGALTKLAPLLR
jgi:hypothetical protein